MKQEEITQVRRMSTCGCGKTNCPTCFPNPPAHFKAKAKAEMRKEICAWLRECGYDWSAAAIERKFGK